jgi:hypothetical protein
LDSAIEKKINDQVETSFQEFLTKKKIKIDNQVNQRESKLIEDWFNEWLDTEVTQILDKAKIDEIKAVNAEIETSLKSLSFQIELSALQASIQESRENAATSVDVAPTTQNNNEVQDNGIKLKSSLRIQ